MIFIKDCCIVIDLVGFYDVEVVFFDSCRYFYYYCVVGCGGNVEVGEGCCIVVIWMGVRWFVVSVGIGIICDLVEIVDWVIGVIFLFLMLVKCIDCYIEWLFFWCC